MESKKYYLHPTAEVRDGKWICTYCGAELPQNLKTDFPCTVSVKVPFDEKVEVSVWNCQASVFVENVNISQFCREKEVERLEKLAEDSVYDAGGAINWSGQYPPSDKLVRYAMRLAKKYTAQLLTVILETTKQKIQLLQKELEEEQKRKWKIKKAVRRYMVRTPQDQAFLQALQDQKIFGLIHSTEAEPTILAIKAEFPEYYQTKEPRQDWTEDTELLRAGYIVCEEEHNLPC